MDNKLFTYSHQGVIQETVTIKFEGYSITLEAGTELGLFVAVLTEKIDTDLPLDTKQEKV